MSQITKRALEQSLKNLLLQKPLNIIPSATRNLYPIGCFDLNFSSDSELKNSEKFSGGSRFDFLFVLLCILLSDLL